LGGCTGARQRFGVVSVSLRRDCLPSDLTSRHNSCICSRSVPILMLHDTTKGWARGFMCQRHVAQYPFASQADCVRRKNSSLLRCTLTTRDSPGHTGAALEALEKQSRGQTSPWIPTTQLLFGCTLLKIQSLLHALVLPAIAEDCGWSSFNLAGLEHG